VAKNVVTCNTLQPTNPQKCVEQNARVARLKYTSKSTVVTVYVWEHFIF